MVQTNLLALDDAFGRNRVGLIFLLPYQLPLCSRGRPGYYCDFKKISLFVSYMLYTIGWLVVSIPFPKGIATCQFFSGECRFVDPVAGAYK